MAARVPEQVVLDAGEFDWRGQDRQPQMACMEFGEAACGREDEISLEKQGRGEAEIGHQHTHVALQPCVCEVGFDRSTMGGRIGRDGEMCGGEVVRLADHPAGPRAFRQRMIGGDQADDLVREERAPAQQFRRFGPVAEHQVERAGGERFLVVGLEAEGVKFEPRMRCGGTEPFHKAGHEQDVQIIG